MSSEVMFSIPIQFIVLLCALTFTWTIPTALQLRRKYGFDVGQNGFAVWAKLNNTVHFTYVQLFVLNCVAEYQSSKSFSEPNLMDNSESMEIP